VLADDRRKIVRHGFWPPLIAASRHEAGGTACLRTREPALQHRS
jgi:hypothetical protein